MRKRELTYLDEIICVSELEHLSSEHSHDTVKFIRRFHRHDATENEIEFSI